MLVLCITVSELVLFWYEYFITQTGINPLGFIRLSLIPFVQALVYQSTAPAACPQNAVRKKSYFDPILSICSIWIKAEAKNFFLQARYFVIWGTEGVINVALYKASL